MLSDKIETVSPEFYTRRKTKGNNLGRIKIISGGNKKMQ